jgi:hypothetical protein
LYFFRKEKNCIKGWYDDISKHGPLHRPRQRRMRNRILVFSASARDQLQQYAEIIVKRLLSLRIDARGSGFLSLLFPLLSFSRARVAAFT